MIQLGVHLSDHTVNRPKNWIGEFLLLLLLLFFFFAFFFEKYKPRDILVVPNIDTFIECSDKTAMSPKLIHSMNVVQLQVSEIKRGVKGSSPSGRIKRVETSMSYKCHIVECVLSHFSLVTLCANPTLLLWLPINVYLILSCIYRTSNFQLPQIRDDLITEE